MKIADAHCDTLTTFPNKPFFEETAHWNVTKFRKSGGVLQYMAIFTPAEYAGSDAANYALRAAGNLYKSLPKECNILTSADDWNDEKLNIVLTLEGASPIINSVENLYAFYQLGVRTITLTHNHRNFLADGVGSNYGLTEFGRMIIEECEKLNIIIDVSHLSDKGFQDVAAIAKKPFMASHSNCRTLCDMPRNLTDDQIKVIVSKKGFIGLNLYTKFVSDREDNLTLQFCKHIEHFLKFGAEDILGLGADLDGIPETPFIDYEGIQRVLTNVLRLDESIVEKIMSKNLINFTMSSI
ncbi:MAG: membrane dipeptidase [bacterium]